MAEPLFGDHPLVDSPKQPMFGDHPLVGDTPTAAAAPVTYPTDVFSEGAAQAAAPAERFLPEVQRAGLSALGQLSMAAGSTIAPAFKAVGGDALGDVPFSLADYFGEKAAAIPQSSTAASLLQMPLSGIPGILGSDPGRDVIQAGGTPEQGQAATGIEAAGNLASLLVPSLGKTLPTRLLMQEAAAPAIAETQRRARNEVVPESMQQPYDPKESILAALGAAPFALMPHGAPAELPPREAAKAAEGVERAQTLQGMFEQPEAAPEAAPAPAPPTQEQMDQAWRDFAASTPPEQVSNVLYGRRKDDVPRETAAQTAEALDAALARAREEAPPTAMGEAFRQAQDRREPAVPEEFAAQLAEQHPDIAPDDHAQAAAVAERAQQDQANGKDEETATFEAQLRDQHPEVAKEDYPQAAEVARLAERAQKVGIDANDILPYKGETDQEYTDRLHAELTEYEARHAPDNPANEPDRSLGVQQAPETPEPVLAEAETTGERQAAPAVVSGGEAEPELSGSEVAPAPEAKAAPEQPAAPPPVEADTAATGIKNATVEAERASAGLDKLVSEAGQTDKEAWQHARQTAAGDPDAGRRLTADLLKNPRAPSKQEVALLLHDRVRISNELRAATEEAGRTEGKTPQQQTADRVRLLDAEQQRADNDLAARKSGTASALSLSARKMMANMDYSLERIKQRAAVAAGVDSFEKLPEAERKQWEQLADDFAKQFDREAESGRTKAKAEKPPVPKRTPDQKMQARVAKDIEKLKGQIEQRLKACPLP